MFHKFSDEAIKVIMHAQEEARILKHKDVGCEHLLLGLIAVEGNVANDVLQLNNLTPFRMRECVSSIRASDVDESPKELPFDDDARKALAVAFEEVKNSNHEQIFSEHLLLGLISLPLAKNKANKAFAKLDVDTRELRISVIYAMLKKGRLEQTGESGLSQEYSKWLLKQCRQVSMFAVSEAMRLKQSEIGSEMLLLGLLAAGGTVIRVLEDFGITLEPTSQKIESLVEQTSSLVTVELPLSVSATKLLRSASDEATQLGHDTLNARHLLLGFTHVQDGIAWQIFREKNVDIEALRAAVLALFEETR